MASAVEVLVEARRLLDEKGWTQGAYAVDADGRWTLQDLSHAASFCSHGACLAAAKMDVGLARSASLLLRDELCLETLGDVLTWNDAPGRTKAEVLAAFDGSIELAKPPV